MSTYEIPKNIKVYDLEEEGDVIDVITQLQSVVHQNNVSTISRSRGICHITREELKDVLSEVEGYVAHCRDNIDAKDR